MIICEECIWLEVVEVFASHSPTPFRVNIMWCKGMQLLIFSCSESHSSVILVLRPLGCDSDKRNLSSNLLRLQIVITRLIFTAFRKPVRDNIMWCKGMQLLLFRCSESHSTVLFLSLKAFLWVVILVKGISVLIFFHYKLL